MRTILVVEESAPARLLIGQCLEAKGYRVLKSRTGREAVFFSEEFPVAIHLVLLDLASIGDKAWETLHDLRMKRSDLRALFICTPAEVEALQKEAFLSGVTLWPTPFSTTDLLAGVETALKAMSPSDRLS
jgi:two-component system, cell cycle sensor histidine kinase and response regulator CckA